MDLQRHQLLHLSAAGWRGLLASTADGLPWDPQASDCLHHWAAHDLPLVVARQGAHAHPGRVAAPLVLGLPAPLRWGRRRIFVLTPRAAVARVAAFPPASEIVPSLPVAQRVAWLALCTALEGCGVAARVYGSHGWQWLSGLPTVHENSDIDLLLPVGTTGRADAVVEHLLAFGAPRDGMRLDGELHFADGTAVAWREWAAWRAGQTARVLVKRLHAASLEDPRQWRQAA